MTVVNWRTLCCLSEDSSPTSPTNPHADAIPAAPLSSRGVDADEPNSATTSTPTTTTPPSLAISPPSTQTTFDDRKTNDSDDTKEPPVVFSDEPQVEEPESMIPPTPRPPLSSHDTVTPKGEEKEDKDQATLTPSSFSKLAKLSSAQTTISHSLTPPTPIDSPTTPQRWPTLHQSNNNSLSPSSSDDASRDPERRETTSTSPSRRSPSPHRRSSSTGSRTYRETLNAYAVEDEDGIRSVNQYVLDRDGKKGPLGKGSYATVERAKDRETGVEYAMKEFSKKRLRQIAASERARRERMAARGRGRGRGGARSSHMARINTVDFDESQGADNLDLVRTEIAIMKKVDHPNIATIHEVIDVTSDDALLIVMELCGGGPIMRVESGKTIDPMPLDQARSVFQQMVLGVAYLHHNHIIHRDIKPDNCLFMADKSHVKLIDFGISKFTAETEDKLDSKGSPAYMPPELLGSGGNQCDSKSARHRQDIHGYASDVWSLGVTLYALVTGGLPFDDSDPTALFRGIREETPKFSSDLPQSLQHLLTRMLDKDPHQRITIPELWDDPWTIDDGKDPLVPYDENCIEFPEPTQAEVDKALNAYKASTFLAMSVVAKLKGKRKKSFSSESSQTTPRSTPQSTPRNLSIDEEEPSTHSEHEDEDREIVKSPVSEASFKSPSEDELNELDALENLPEAVKK